MPSPQLTFHDVGAPYRKNYKLVCDDLNDFANRGDVLGFKELFGSLCLYDLFFLMYYALDVREINHPWLVARVRDMEDRNDNTLDLWPRFHFKSSLATYGLIIQDILKNPEERIVIFSWSKDSAGDFLTKIKQTLEDNALLKATFDNVLYQKPSTEAPQWSVEGGLTVKRRGKFLENTLEAHSIEKLPTGKHFTKRVYDDIEVPENVTTSEMIKKIESQFRMSAALIDGTINRAMVVGTIYHFAGIHCNVLLKDSSWYHRVYKATDDGTVTGNPVLMTKKAFIKLAKELGPYHTASQMLMNPVAADLQEFKEEWLEYYVKLPARMNKYLIVDPANEKHKKSDFTCMGVIGIDPLGNYYLIDLIRKKLNLPERKDALFRLVEKHPNIKMPVGYEEYGANSDTQYIKECQKAEGIHFRILPLAGTTLSKEDRIRKLIPIFADHKFFLPFSIMQDGENLIKVFVTEEFLQFPFSTHDDILDMLSRIKDPKLNAKGPVNYNLPQGNQTEPQVVTTWDPYNAYQEGA